MILVSSHGEKNEEKAKGQDCSSGCCGELKHLQELIRHYTTPGIAPPSARMIPNVKVEHKPDFRLWHWWKYGWFVASKATQMTGDALVHTIWGPRKKSWGIQMTLMSSLMRNAGQHTDLMDVPSIRMFMGMGGMGPAPPDALVTPVTFRVKKRRLRGILEEFDRQETGKRELSGEWVVGKRTWNRLQTEWKAAQIGESGSHTFAKKTERVMLYIHGGAYYVGSASEKRVISVPLAQYTDSRVFSLDYRLAPETHFPGPLHDAVIGYFRLIDDLHIPPENIIICGDSAGGGLSLALLMYLRDNDYPMPAGAILMSPWVDLTMSGESWESNAQYDVIPVFSPKDHMNPIANYLGDNIDRYLMHPYASPLFGDFKDLPPLLIQSGDSEVLRDEIALLAHKAELAGVNVRHELYQDGVHVFQTFPFLEVWSRSFMAMHDFVRNTLHHLQRESPQVLASKAERSMKQEIDTHAALVISADGTETSVGVEGAKASLLDDDGPDTADSHCLNCGRRQDSTWSSSSETDVESEDEVDIKISVVPPSTDPSPLNTRSNTEDDSQVLPPSKGLKRVSSVSSIPSTLTDSPPTLSKSLRDRSRSLHLANPIAERWRQSRSRSRSRFRRPLTPEVARQVESWSWHFWSS
ncbi:Alpha/Beta hydrolase protein [Desarmillaria ectypa]|nr:Alpha/Beta hydrolase protein [Desarmillaria ectypa]